MGGMRGIGDSDSPMVSVGRWERVIVEHFAAHAIQRKNRPSTAEELFEDVLSIENEREPISKVSSWDLATRAPLENREVPTWHS